MAPAIPGQDVPAEVGGPDEAPQAVVCLVTTPIADAGAIAEALVTARLAACVNVLPAVASIYCWHGRVERDEESLLVIKTTRAMVEPLIAATRAIHPYENFELIALDIGAGHPPYLQWIVDSVETGGEPPRAVSP